MPIFLQQNPVAVIFSPRGVVATHSTKNYHNKKLPSTHEIKDIIIPGIDSMPTVSASFQHSFLVHQEMNNVLTTVKIGFIADSKEVLTPLTASSECYSLLQKVGFFISYYLDTDYRINHTFLRETFTSRDYSIVKNSLNMFTGEPFITSGAAFKILLRSPFYEKSHVLSNSSGGKPSVMWKSTLRLDSQNKAPISAEELFNYFI